jgi:hypothetical protein
MICSLQNASALQLQENSCSESDAHPRFARAWMSWRTTDSLLMFLRPKPLGFYDAIKYLFSSSYGDTIGVSSEEVLRHPMKFWREVLEIGHDIEKRRQRIIACRVLFSEAEVHLWRCPAFYQK